LKTKSALHEALVRLAREKPYDAIAVKEILARANVGRSTFYTHFADKDDLLDSGVHEMLAAIDRRPRSGDVIERIVGFARPLLEHIDGHRRRPGPQMAPESRSAMHGRLQDVLVDIIQEDVAAVVHGRQPTVVIPAELVALHVASTFVLVLNWWADTNAPLAPVEVDARFRALVEPALLRIVRSGH